MKKMADRDRNQQQEKRRQPFGLAAVMQQIIPKLGNQLGKWVRNTDAGQHIIAEWIRHEVMGRVAFSVIAEALEKFEKGGNSTIDELTDKFSSIVLEFQRILEEEKDKLSPQQIEAISQGLHVAIQPGLEETAGLFQRIMVFPEPLRTSGIRWFLHELPYEHQQIGLRIIATLDDAALRRFLKGDNDQKREAISLFAQEELQAQATQATMVNFLESFGGWLQQSNIELQEQVNRGFFGRRRGRN